MVRPLLGVERSATRTSTRPNGTMRRDPKLVLKTAEPIPAEKLKKWRRRSSADYDLMPGSNRYGVTDLRLDLQADCLPEPVVKWGSIFRGAPITGGCWFFYTDDYKFTSLWSWPSVIGKTRCYAALEPNYSIGPADITPRWQAIEKIAMKRWLARYWQEEFGIRIVVDLNVNPDYYDLAFLGVPKGWRSYATRVHSDEDADWDDIEEACNLAIERAGTEDIFFAVFGGGEQARKYCLGRGWLWMRCSRNWRDPFYSFVPKEHDRIIHRMPPKLAKELLPEMPRDAGRGPLKKKRTRKTSTEPVEATGDDR